MNDGIDDTVLYEMNERNCFDTKIRYKLLSEAGKGSSHWSDSRTVASYVIVSAALRSLQESE